MSSADVAVSALEAQIAVDAISPDGSRPRGERRRFGGIERTHVNFPGRSRSPTDSRSSSPVDRPANFSAGGGGRHAWERRINAAGGEDNSDARDQTRASTPPSRSPTAAAAGGKGLDGSTSSSTTRRHTGFGKVLRGGGDKLKQLTTLRKSHGGGGGGGGATNGTGSSSTSASSAITGDGADLSPVSGTGHGRWHRPGSRFFTAPRANAGGVNDFSAGKLFRSSPGGMAKSPTRP
ncbi:unnamed protein product [Laminaria digitata]